MYYRLAIQQGRDHLDQPAPWQWKSTALSSLQSLFQVLRLYGALPQERLRVFSSSSREGLAEELEQENKGLPSCSVTAAHFLQQRMLRPPTAVRSISAEREGGTEQERGTVAVISPPAMSERGGEGGVLASRGRSALERRREELESGPGGDHDVPYRFVLPPSMPQVLAWMSLLVRVQHGELHP